MNKKNDIDSNQLMIFAIASQIGIGVTTSFSDLVMNVGHDGWISIFISGVIFDIFIIFNYLLMNRYQNQSIFQITKLLFGKYLGSVINLSLIIYTLMISSIELHTLIDIIRITGLKTTPNIVLGILIIIPTAYLLTGGLKHVCRYLNIIILVMITALIYIGLAHKQFNVNFLKPIAEANISQIYNGVKISIFSFLGIELIPIIYHNVTDKSKALKKLLLANSISMIYYIIIILSCVAIFGETFMKQMNIPLLNIARIHYSNMLERVDLFFLIMWVYGIGCTLVCYLYSAYKGMINLINLKKGHLYIIFFTCVMVIYMDKLHKDYISIKKYTDYLGIFGLGILVFYAVCLIFSYINKRGVSK